MRNRLPSRVVAGSISVALLIGCGSDDAARCLSSDRGEVCADGSDGSVEFRGSGLEPDSEVVVDHPGPGDSRFVVESDGTFQPNGRAFMTFVAGTTTTFTISATDADGNPIEGEIIVVS